MIEFNDETNKMEVDKEKLLRWQFSIQHIREELEEFQRELALLEVQSLR